MAMKAIIQNNKTSQMSSITLMFEYDIDNTLNTIKENSQFVNKMKSHLAGNNCNLKEVPNSEINNNIKGNCNLQSNARKRWKLLAKVLRRNSDKVCLGDPDEIASVRRFKSFDLLRQDNFCQNTELSVLSKIENWYTYKIELNSSDYSVNIHHINRYITAEDLIGFNNTGNICVWPSEEALTVYALSDIHCFSGKWVLELGGGMTCLCGLIIAKYAKPYAVHLTDGNTLSVENVRRSICLNDLSCYTKCSILRWEDTVSRSALEYQKFDYILSADCLFFDDVRTALVDTIWYFLSKTGIAFVMAPRRGGTLMKFVKECRKKGFICEIIQRYNEIIWQKHLKFKECDLYDDDIHYPVLIKLKKCKQIEQ